MHDFKFAVQELIHTFIISIMIFGNNLDIILESFLNHVLDELI